MGLGIDVAFLSASATAVAAAATATLSGAAGKITYITGFQVTGGGATSAAIATVQVVGLAGAGTAEYRVGVPAGATATISPLQVTYTTPHPASTSGSAIEVRIGSFGSGNTIATVAAQGFRR